MARKRRSPEEIERRAKIRDLLQLAKGNRRKSARKVMSEAKRYITGWLNYYRTSSMKQKMQEWNKRLRRRLRVYIWKQWKKPKTKLRNLMKFGMPEHFARIAANSRRAIGQR